MFLYNFNSILRILIKRLRSIWSHISEGIGHGGLPCKTGQMKAMSLCMWIIVVAFSLPVCALQVKDDRGMIIHFDRSPQRIVSLLPSLTEAVCALGQCQRLVGVDCYSNYPQSVKHLPQVGEGLNPNIEAIVALQPDVVLMAKSSRVDERLQSLGIQVLALEPKTHADVKRVLEQIGQLLAVSHAPDLWRAIDAAVTAAAQSLPARIKATRVYFEVNPAPYAASEGSFIGETLQRLGAKNIVPASLGPFPKINAEYVVRANPDVMMVDGRHHQGFEDRPGWQGIRAIREGRVCVLSVAQNDVVVRPGPRLAEGARIMAQCLQSKAP
jgi:iron complex transport system substrate-binding protein